MKRKAKSPNHIGKKILRYRIASIVFAALFLACGIVDLINGPFYHPYEEALVKSYKENPEKERLSTASITGHHFFSSFFSMPGIFFPPSFGEDAFNRADERQTKAILDYLGTSSLSYYSDFYAYPTNAHFGLDPFEYSRDTLKDLEFVYTLSSTIYYSNESDLLFSPLPDSRYHDPALFHLPNKENEVAISSKLFDAFMAIGYRDIETETVHKIEGIDDIIGKKYHGLTICGVYTHKEKDKALDNFVGLCKLEAYDYTLKLIKVNPSIEEKWLFKDKFNPFRGFLFIRKGLDQEKELMGKCTYRTRFNSASGFSFHQSSIVSLSTDGYDFGNASLRFCLSVNFEKAAILFLVIDILIIIYLAALIREKKRIENSVSE